MTTLIRKKYTIRVFRRKTKSFENSHPKLGPRREGKYPSEFPFGPPPGPVHLWSTYFITKSEIQDFFWICSNNKALPGVREPTHASLFSVMSVKHFFGLLSFPSFDILRRDHHYLYASVILLLFSLFTVDWGPEEVQGLAIIRNLSIVPLYYFTILKESSCTTVSRIYIPQGRSLR